MIDDIGREIKQTPRALIVGLGDARHTDAGVGLEVADALAQGGLPEGVEVYRAGGALDAVSEMADYSAAVMILAAEMHLPPGEVRTFTPEELEEALVETSVAGRGLGLTDALEVAGMTGDLPAIRVIGVQPGDVGPGFSRLSEAVKAAMPRVAEEARAALAELLADLPEAAAPGDDEDV